MKSSTPTPSSIHRLQRARELVKHQQALHSNLVSLQQRVAGLVPRPALDRLYAAGEIDAPEYVTLLLAQGQEEAAAETMLANAHEAHKAGEPSPWETGMAEPDLPQYSGPKRAAKKVRKSGPELRGHPFD